MSINALRDSARSDLELNVIKALSKDYVPLSIPAINKALPVGGRPNVKDLKLLLAELVTAEQVTHFAGRTPKFSIGPVVAWVRARVLARLALGPQTESSLKRVLTPAYELEFKAAAADLVKQRKMFLHPSLTPRGRPEYSLTPPDPLRYIVKELNKLLCGAQRLGFSSVQLREAVARGVAEWAPSIESSARHLIVDVMRQLEPRVDQGAAVSIPQLRSAMGDGYGKRRFDELVIELARLRVIELQSHAWSSRLTPAEQESMIENGRGGWYDSAGLLKETTQ